MQKVKAIKGDIVCIALEHCLIKVVFKLRTSDFVPIHLVLWTRRELTLFSVVTLF